MALKRKAMAAAITVSLVTLIVSGTFAWTSLYSQKLNEWYGSGNPETGPGGTLHDDHDNEVADDQNKQVYVENWGDEPLYVRIKLGEYMEVGQGSGLKSMATDQTTGKPISNPDNLSLPVRGYAGYIDYPEQWSVIWTGDRLNEAGDAPTGYPPWSKLSTFWTWQMGGQKYYYPASVDSRTVKSYVDQNSPGDLTAESVNNDGINARQTLTASIMSMTAWKAAGSPIGNYWVIDRTDGWAYWAAPLQPNDATGLLINTVTMATTAGNYPQYFDLSKSYYYGIHVTAQMATKDGAKDSNGVLDNYTRFGDISQGGWTEDGKSLMDIITGSVDKEVKNINVIYLSFTQLGLVTQEYKIDFVSKKVWEFDIRNGIQWRDPTAENEGYTFAGDLSDEKISSFLKDCSTYGMENWEEFYDNKTIIDGLQWSLKVVYSDSTIMKSAGSNAYPETWNEMQGAFQRLIGKTWLYDPV